MAFLSVLGRSVVSFEGKIIGVVEDVERNPITGDMVAVIRIEFPGSSVSHIKVTPRDFRLREGVLKLKHSINLSQEIPKGKSIPEKKPNHSSKHEDLPKLPKPVLTPKLSPPPDQTAVKEIIPTQKPSESMKEMLSEQASELEPIPSQETKPKKEELYGRYTVKLEPPPPRKPEPKKEKLYGRYTVDLKPPPVPDLFKAPEPPKTKAPRFTSKSVENNLKPAHSMPETRIETRSEGGPEIEVELEKKPSFSITKKREASCSNCRKLINLEFAFCPFCANPIHICPNCSKRLEPDWIACPFCGFRLQKE